MASINVKPWGCSRRQFPARRGDQNQWLRVRSRFPALLAGHDPVVSRVRTPIGRRGNLRGQDRVDDRAAANAVCQKLQSVGGACVW